MIAIHQFEVAQRFAMGCHPKALLRWPPRVHPQTQLEPTAILTATVNIQGFKDELLVLGGLALLAASYQSQEWLALIYLGAPLGLHNPNMKFTANQDREDYQNPFT